MKNPTETFASPNYLLVANEPLSEKTLIKKLSLDEIRMKFDFEYLEHICMPVGIPFLGHNADLEFNWPEHLKPRLKAPLNDSLVVCFISPEVGYGVFAKEVIPAGTIIGLYAGEVEAVSAENDYGMSTTAQGFRINASRLGGITRFIQHMPDDVESIVREISALDLKQKIDLCLPLG